MKNEDYDTRLPRLFVESDLAENTTISLPEDSAHYLKNVLRRPEGSKLRVFNGQDGEFIASFVAESKKSHVLNIVNRIKEQPGSTREIHLIFALIKKDRQDFLIEKAVELGATHIHPMVTQQTVIRDLNEKRVAKQIQEAAEQCERLDIPKLSPLLKLEDLLRTWPDHIPLYVALERADAKHFGQIEIPVSSAILIGPEGGFSDAERELILKNKKVTAVSFGENILRAETAAIFGLSLIAATT